MADAKDEKGKQVVKKTSSFQGSQVPIKFAKRKSKETPEFRGILRLVGKDVDGHLTISESLRRVKGIGFNLASNLSVVVTTKLGIPLDELVGNLNETQFSQLEDVVKFPQKYGIRAFLLNRQKDSESGEMKNLVMTDLGFSIKQDVARETELRSYRGWRHNIGQKVRGQHSRTTGRTGMTVGVLKKAIKAQKAAAATGAQEKSAAPAKEKEKK
ncbi:MAG: 30S ribosomal protein S13 [Candidatus Micrarchaeota archaeon]